MRVRTVFLLISLLLLLSPCLAQKTENKCQEWQLRLQPNTSSPFRDDRDKTDEQIFEGIDCLLKLKGKKHGSNISGATSGDVSQLFPDPTSIEVAALYYITYLVYQKWDFADAPYLVSKPPKLNSSKDVAEAYKAYRTWINKIKKDGLKEARKQPLDPLAGTKVRWY